MIAENLTVREERQIMQEQIDKLKNYDTQLYYNYVGLLIFASPPGLFLWFLFHQFSKLVPIESRLNPVMPERRNLCCD